MRWPWSQPAKVVIEPKAGEEWWIKGNFTLGEEDPFPKKRKDCLPAKVLETKDGWVRFSIGTAVAYSDERLPMNTFLAIYGKDEVPE